MIDNANSLTDNNVSKSITDILNTNRVPHAIVLQCEDIDVCNDNVKYLSMWAVCNQKKPPCTECNQCKKALNKNHIDIYYAQKFGKKQIVNVDEIRFICKDAYLKPHEGRAKVYIIEDCDKMQLEAQNAFLKLLEEPPQDILFILTCSKYENILSTIRSRVTYIKVEAENENKNELAFEIAKEMLQALCESSEYNLMKTSSKLSDRENALQILNYIEDISRDALTSSYNNKFIYGNTSEMLSKYIKRKGLINIISKIDSAREMLKANVNMTLFTTWICSELRKQKYS